MDITTIIIIMIAALDLVLYLNVPRNTRMSYPWYIRLLPLSGYWLYWNHQGGETK